MADLANVYVNLQAVMDAFADPKKNKHTVGTLTTTLDSLQKGVKDLADFVAKMSVEKGVSEKRTRELEDEVDDYKQKHLAGKFIITCDRKKTSKVKTQEELAKDGGDKALPAHIVDLAKTKYDADIKVEDIASCHYLPKGGIFFSLWNQKPGSPSSGLTEAIKASKDKTKNIFINFMMTRRRSSLLFEVRQLKKQKKIARYYSDEKGAISIKVKDDDKNIKLSSFYQTKNSPVKTYTIEELHIKVSELQPTQPQPAVAQPQ